MPTQTPLYFLINCVTPLFIEVELYCVMRVALCERDDPLCVALCALRFRLTADPFSAYAVRRIGGCLGGRYPPKQPPPSAQLPKFYLFLFAEVV